MYKEQSLSYFSVFLLKPVVSGFFDPQYHQLASVVQIKLYMIYNLHVYLEKKKKKKPRGGTLNVLALLIVPNNKSNNLCI